MVLNKTIASKTASYLLQINAIKLNIQNPYKWSSGWNSPIYCDNRICLSFPKIRDFLANSIADEIKKNVSNNFIIAGVATGAIGIGMLVANKLNAPFIYVRPEKKKHGILSCQAFNNPVNAFVTPQPVVKKHAPIDSLYFA